MNDRRRCLRIAIRVAIGTGIAVAVNGPVRAHTPYRQWEVYRQKHLLIGCHRDDPSSYALAKGVVAMLGHALPDARARVARGPAATRIASLLGTEQLDVAILKAETSEAVRTGSGRFAAYGPQSLRALYTFGAHRLVAHERLDPEHADLIIAALESLVRPHPDHDPNAL